jgi:phage regulator Rha-like protein
MENTLSTNEVNFDKRNGQINTMSIESIAHIWLLCNISLDNNCERPTYMSENSKQIKLFEMSSSNKNVQ